CRCIPGLFASLSKIHYPFPEDTVLITQNVEIMRDNVNYNLFPRGAIYMVSVVSAAAPHLHYEDFNEARVRRTLENMYSAVKHHLPNTDTLILGAWGCGAYRNDPITMSRIMNDVNLNFGGMFKNVIFSVPEGIYTKEFRDNIRTLKSNNK